MAMVRLPLLLIILYTILLMASLSSGSAPVRTSSLHRKLLGVPGLDPAPAAVMLGEHHAADLFSALEAVWSQSLSGF